MTIREGKQGAAAEAAGRFRTPPPRIAIAGAGIAGLTMALLLARHGLTATVFERAAALEEVGAGLQLSPNALRVLDQLDLLPALRDVAVEATSVDLRRSGGWRIASVPVHADDDTPYLSIHRADLQAVLLAAVRRTPAITLQLGAELGRVSTDFSAATIEVETNGTRERDVVDLLIGADGVRSPLAKQARLAPAVPTGTTAWRTTIESADLPPELQPANVIAWLGARHHAVAYPIRAGRAVNLVMIAPGQETDPASGKTVPPQFRSWDSRLTGLIERAAPPTPWPLAGAPASRPFVIGGDRIVLIGDAAHAMAPYAAQGAGMAIEDAAVLAAAIAENADVTAAARAYEAIRRPRIDKVRNRVAFHRFVYHLPLPFSLGRDTVLALRPKAALRADLAWLYDWQPPGIVTAPA